ncbi:unnamed protein product [Ectocarpus sp. 8 AP-2014]
MAGLCPKSRILSTVACDPPQRSMRGFEEPGRTTPEEPDDY